MAGRIPADRVSPMIMVILRFLLAAVFLYAGFAKLFDPASLAEDILQYQIVPESLVNLFVLTLPLFEIISALALIIGPWKRQAAFNIVVLCVLFLSALGYATARGLTIECHCFGATSGATMGMAVVRDVVLLIISIVVYWKERRVPEGGRIGRQ